MPKIEIYSKDYCPSCVQAKMLLTKKGVDFVEYDITHDPEKQMEMMERAAGRRTVPQIFINDKGVGGCDDLYALDRAGTLDPLLV